MNLICPSCGVSTAPIEPSPLHYKCPVCNYNTSKSEWKFDISRSDDPKPTITPKDKINPDHYKPHPSGVECIQITEWMNFNLGNVVKYLWRSGHKNGLEDLRKAQWYLKREIERLEKEAQKKNQY